MAAVGIAVGILTLLQLYKRRSGTAEAESTDEGHGSPETATEHAAAAAEKAAAKSKEVTDGE